MPGLRPVRNYRRKETAMEHPCKACLRNTPTRYHQCEHSCHNYRLFLATVTGEELIRVSQESADMIRHNQEELDADDLC
jgi:hypothetical protein